ncbi:MAG: hypothetical protein IBGAMO2_540001 [Arenicellales bacterium IbO2]|nr:MAG: hypothetical protein IBGAMO2_540001 [Arenicellales bacterium IbO2]
MNAPLCRQQTARAIRRRQCGYWEHCQPAKPACRQVWHAAAHCQAIAEKLRKFSLFPVSYTHLTLPTSDLV